MNAVEVNFDGLVGPTHHFGGLSPGNIASTANRHAVSHPRAAALAGLAKMKRLADRGIVQAVLPPQRRPHWGFLKEHGFTGTPAEILQSAAKRRPDLLSVAYSSSFMWTANAAWVSPSADTGDGRVHLTPANLATLPHRRLESDATTQILRSIFADPHAFIVYDPLPGDPLLSDEGAANHMRLCPAHGAAGIEVFVYGTSDAPDNDEHPQRYPARQTRQACERVAALHELPEERRLFVQQNPVAIDAGVFHNDVIAVANESVLLCHERAFVRQERFLASLRERCDFPLHILTVSDDEFSLDDAVRTYLFNSQLLSLPEGGMWLLCPEECRKHSGAQQVIRRLLADENPICEVGYVDVQQSMRNGGGPACLRLRVVLTEEQRAHVNGALFLTDERCALLCDWVERHYREEMTGSDLADPGLAEEGDAAFSELETLLELRLPPASRFIANSGYEEAGDAS